MLGVCNLVAAAMASAPNETFPWPDIVSTRLSPTTELLTFQPSTWPLRANEAANTKLLLLGQRTCPLKHFRYETCANDAITRFDIRGPDSEVQQYSLVRANPAADCSAASQGHVAPVPGLDPNLFSVLYKATVADTSESECRWTLSNSTAEFARMRFTGDGGGLLPSPIPGTQETVLSQTGASYAVEVCLTRRDCTKNTFICTNSYAAAVFTTETAFLLRQTITPYDDATQIPIIPFSWPYEGTGDIGDILRMTPESGPYLPCPTGQNGLQLPCSEDAEELASGRFHPVDDLVLHVTDFDLDKLLHVDMGGDNFDVKLDYKVAWSDRLATHPCTVSLYPYGRGVPKGRAALTVNATEWWVPTAGGSAPLSTSQSHRSSLKVLRGPGLPVVEPCTNTQDCPFPTQLWFQDAVEVVAKYSHQFDTVKFPFDKHQLVAELKIAENVDAGTAVRLVADDIDDGKLIDAPGYLYAGHDFKVSSYSFSVEGTSIFIKLNLERTQLVLRACRIWLPTIAIAMLVTYSGATRGASRVKFLGFSLIAAVFLLDGSALGLPPQFNGLPFALSLVIIHIAIGTLVLVMSFVENELRFRLNKNIMVPGKWQETLHARARWEEANAVVAPHRDRALAGAGINPDPGRWPSELGSGEPLPGGRNKSLAEVTVEIPSRTAEDVPDTVAKPPAPGGGGAPSAEETASKLEKMVDVLSVMPELMARAGAEPTKPFEPDAFKADWQRGEDIENFLHYAVPFLYILSWAISSAVYSSKPDPY